MNHLDGNAHLLAGDPRLYFLLARESPLAVIFRRGPSKRVQLLQWNTDTDTFAEGQWFNGRVYERRCDLSPDGSLLAYFAANYRKPYYSWTAVSRPPYFTALALWPKGDGWGGGGLFASSDELLLNHRQPEMDLAPEFAVPPWLKVRPFGDHSGWGEDDPIWSERLRRDGWIVASDGHAQMNASDAKVWITYDPPVTWEKPCPIAGRSTILRFHIRGLKERQGRWYITDHEVVDSVGRELLSLRSADWADWLPSGDLVFTSAGSLHRLSCSADGRQFSESRLIANLAARVFTRLKAPRAFRTWPAR